MGLVEDDELKLKIQRRQEYKVILSKKEFPSDWSSKREFEAFKGGGASGVQDWAIGLDVNCQAGRDGLTIIGMREGGLAHTWTLSNPDKPLREQDRIVEVNGYRGEPKDLLAKMKQVEMLELIIVPIKPI